MKRIISILLVMLLVLSFATAFADNTQFTVPITVTSVMKNSKGEVTNSFNRGEDAYLEYTITPQDIPLAEVSDDSPVDIVFVVDTSGSMNDRNKKNTRLKDAKNAMSSFVNEMSTQQNAEQINISIVTFSYYAKDTMSFMNVGTDKDKILACINGITAEGSTNGGDGLRVAYNKLNENRPADAQKYIIYLGDGENNILTYESGYTTDNRYIYKYKENNNGNHFGWDDDIIITDKNYGESLKDFVFDGYDFGWFGLQAKYTNFDLMESIYHDIFYYYKDLKHFSLYDSYYNGRYSSNYYLGNKLYTKDASNMYITNQNYNSGKKDDLTPIGYATAVASELIAKNNITTYVIGVGDDLGYYTKGQKEQNQQICKSANNTSFISDLYFPVNDTEMLEKLYSEIGTEILLNIPVKEVKLQLQFSRELETNSNNNVIDIQSVTIDDNPSEYLTQGSCLVASVSDFEYKLVPEEKVYRANPIVLRIKLSIGEECETGLVEISNSKLIYKSLGVNASIDLAPIAFEIVEDVKPVTVAALLEIGENNSTLTIIPDEDCDELYIRTGSGSDEYIVELSNLKKGEKYVIDLTKEQMNKFTENSIYIETVLNNKNKKIIGKEKVAIISFGGVINERVNYTSDYSRLSVVQILGEQNLSDFNFIVNGKAISTTAPIYQEGIHKKELELLDGINEITVTPKIANDTNNITKLSFKADVCAKRPRAEYKKIDDKSVEIKFSEDSCQLKQFLIRLFDEEGNIIKEYVENNVISGKKSFRVSFDGLSINDYILEIEAIDIHNNGIMCGDKYNNLIQTGLYIKGKNNFYTGNPSVVLGYRYQFAIKFIVTKDCNITIKTDNEAKLELKNCVIYDFEKNTPLTELPKQFKMEQNSTKAIYNIQVSENVNDNKLIPGKEYLLVFDFRVVSNTKLNELNLFMSLDNITVQQKIIIMPEPNVN